MKFIRFFLTCLALTIVLLALLVAIAFSPIVQTWAAQRALAQQAGGQASLESFSAGFGRVEIADLHLPVGGGVLTVPSLQARLPVAIAAWERKVPIRSLVAKGWTLDLRRTAVPAGARSGAISAPADGGPAESTTRAGTVSASAVAGVFRGILSGWEFPCDGSLDGVDLEGDLLVAVPPGSPPTRVHVVIKGGGMAPGHAGIFSIEAAVLDFRLPENSATARGRLVATMKSPRTVDRVEFKADVSAKNGSPAGNLAWSLDATAARDAGGEAYTFDLARDGRHLAIFNAHFTEATRRLEGTWKVDLKDSDVAPFAPDRPRWFVAAAGAGQFDTDPSFAQVHARGDLSGGASQWTVLDPQVTGMGEAVLAADFDLVRRGHSIRFDRLNVALGGAQPVAVVRSLQPFEVNERSGEIKVSDPHGDWLEGSLRKFPLMWLSGLTGEFAFAAGAGNGEFVIRVVDGGFVLQPKSPFTATGVAVRRAGRMLGRGLDLSLSLAGNYARPGWEVEVSPLTISAGGRRLATLAVKASRSAGADQPVKFGGTWSAELAALAAQPAFAGKGWLAARSASGDFSGSVGASTEIQAKLAVVGHDPRHVLSATVGADVDGDGTISFNAPVEISIGSKALELTVEGTWAGGPGGNQVDVKLKGGKVDLEHLRLLAGPLAAIGGAPPPANSAAGVGVAPTPEGARDRTPFWGDWAGHVRVAFEQVKAGHRVFDDVGGTLKLERNSLLVEGGHGAIGHHRLEQVNGSIAFEGAAEFPYRLNATAADDDVDGASIFSAPKSDQQPVFEGRFKVARTLSAEGGNLAGLLGGMQDEFRLMSTQGIVRLLRTNVAQALPTAPESAVSTALIDVGSVFGKLLGARQKSLASGEVKVGPTTQAVLDYDNEIAEIGYDRLTITAVRDAAGTIRVAEFALIGDEVHLTGSGEITHVKGLPPAQCPLRAEVHFGLRGRAAELLGKIGLLSDKKDSLGYTLIDRPILFGGSLEHLAQNAWREALVEAATRKPVAGKKGG